jgi:hypothetical protein
MADIYNASRGTVIRSDQSTNGSIVKLIPGFESNPLLILTDVRATRNQIVQYLKTLDTSNYGYAWGEGPGTITVSGLIFFVDGCVPSGGGAEAINDYYNENNVYNADGREQRLMIGNAAFLGHLEKMTIVAEQNEYNYGSFVLEFSILPKE